MRPKGINWTIRRSLRATTAIGAAVSVMAYAWPAVAAAAPTTPAPKPAASRTSTTSKPVAWVPAVGHQFTFSAQTEATTSGPAASSGIARSASQSTVSAPSAGAPGLFVAPQPVTQLASLTGTNGGVVSIASGEFSASGHQDVAAVICNPCGAWGQPPFQPSTDGTFSIAVLPGLGDGTFGTPTQLSPVGPNIALSTITAADLGNGHTDLIVSEIGRTDTNPYQFLIYLGNGDGTFQPSPIAVNSPGPIVRFQVADLGNGHPDLVAIVTGGAGGNEVVVFTGNGTGGFTAGTPMSFCPGSPSGCETTDSMTDLVVAPLAVGGKPDILVSQQSPFVQNNGYQNSTDDVAVFINDGSGTFSPPSYPVTDMDLVSGIEVGDFTGSSGPPSVLLVGNCLGNPIAFPSNCQLLLPGNGDGTFQAPSLSNAVGVEGSSMRAAVADNPFSFTNGGPSDALWLTTYGNNQSSALDVMVNSGTGGFTRQELVGVLPGAIYASSALPVDLTGDGQPDLVVGGGPVGSFASSPGLWVVPANTKNPGTFLTAQGYLGFVGSQSDESVAVGDFRKTGHQDVLTVARGTNAEADVTLLPGNGDGTFGTAQDGLYPGSAGNVFPRFGLVTGDFNGDGNLDTAYFDAGGELDYQLGHGDGTFASVVQVPANLSVPVGTAVDLVETTLNGEPDIIASVPNGSTEHLESWLWNPATSAFGAPVVSGPLPAVQGGFGDIAVGHFKTGDPLDLATVIQPSGGVPEVDVVTGSTDGTFNTSSPTQVATPCSTATGGSGNFSYGAIAVGNLGNGHDDIVWQCISALYVALGNGDGTFQTPQSFSEPTGGNNAHLLLTDLEGDGHLDAVAYGGDYNVPTGMAVWHDNGDGSFAAAQLYTLGLPENNNLGKTVTAAPLTTSGTDDLMVLGDAGDGNDDLTVWLTTGGRPALEAGQVSAPTPASPVPGNIVTGSYHVTDTGGAVSSSWVDSVYLASGATGTNWTDSDPLLERVPQAQTLAGGGSYTGPYSFPLGAVTPGTYHLIVVPDSSDVLSGGNETPAASPSFTVGQIPTLTVGTPVDTSIEAAQSLYYQLSVTASTDVHVAITGLPAGDGVTLLGQNGQVPTAMSATVGSASASVTVPGSSPGTWYIIIQPSASVGATPVPITISASNPGTTLDTVTPAGHVIDQVPPAEGCSVSAVGGGGKVTLCPPPPPPPPVGDGLMTLTLQGSGFGSDLSVRLVDGATAYTATTVTRRDSTLAFASFPVQAYVGGLPAGQMEPGDVQPGTYDVVVSSGGQTSTRAKGFTVTVGGYNPAPAALSVSFSAPSELREGFVGQLAVTLTNHATTDLALPVIDVTSPDAVLGGPGVTDTTDFTSTLEIDDPVLSAEPLDNPSPPGILGAGQSFTLDLSILADPGTPAHAALSTTTTIVNSSDGTPINWAPILAPIQPPNISASSWSTVVSDFGHDVGTTEGSYAIALLRAFSEARANDIALDNQAEALNYLAQQEIETGAGAPVAGTLDLTSASAPLPKVALTLTGQTGQFSATSATDGKFSFWDVTPGTYELDAAGYLPKPAMTVDANPTATGLTVVVQPAATLSGVVTDSATTAPVAGVVVTATDDQSSVISEPTGADGTYNIVGLDPGNVTISVSPPQSTGLATPAPATITVATGSNDESISLNPGGSITGTVVAPGGGAPTGASVWAEPQSGPAIYGTVGADGSTFSIAGLSAGNYTVVAEADGAGAISSSQTVTGTSTTGPITLQLTPPGAVSGQVTDALTGVGISGVTVSSDADGTQGVTAVTDSKGDYALNGLPDGSQDLHFDPPGQAHFSSAVTVDVTGGAQTANTTLNPAATATLVATDGNGMPLANTGVVLVEPNVNNDPSSTLSESFTTDSSGTVVVSGLQPGTYDLQVPGSQAHTSFSIDAANPDPTITVAVPAAKLTGTVLDSSGQPAAGVPVVLASSSGPFAWSETDTSGTYSFPITGSQSVDVIAWSNVVGELIDSNVAVSAASNTTAPTLHAGTATLAVTVGNPSSTAVDGATVTLEPSSITDSSATVSARTGSSGGASFSNLTPGTYRLSVDDGTDVPQTVPVTIAAGGNSQPVTLAGAGTLTGNVTDDHSNPVSGAFVWSVDQTTGEVGAAISAQDGTYSIGQLAPGDTYNVSVSSDGDAPVVVVGASPGTPANATLPTTGATLTVNLAPNSSGNTVPGGTATLADSNGVAVASTQLGPARSPSDEQATATFGPLAAGSYTVQFSGPGLGTVSQQVTVSSGGTSVTLTAPAAEGLTLPPGAGLGPSTGASGAIATGGTPTTAADATTPTQQSITQLLYQSFLSGINAQSPQGLAQVQAALEARAKADLAVNDANDCPPVPDLRAQVILDQINLHDALGNAQDAYDKLLIFERGELFELSAKAAGIAGAVLAALVSLAGVLPEAMLAVDGLVSGLSTAQLSALGLTTAEGEAAINFSVGGVQLVGDAAKGLTLPGVLSAVNTGSSLRSAILDLQTAVANSMTGSGPDPVTTANDFGSLAKTFEKLAGVVAKTGSKIVVGGGSFILSAMSAAFKVQHLMDDYNDAVSLIKDKIQEEETALQQYDHLLNDLAQSLYALEQAPKHGPPCTMPPPPPPPPPPFPPKPGPNSPNTNVNNQPASVSPGDPNEILGSIGDGSAGHYIKPGTSLPYTIFFKNEPTASAPATEVVVTTPLPAGTNPSTLQLTGYGFGQTSVPMSGNVTSFSQLLTGLKLANGDDVSAAGAYSSGTNTITWTLEAINPATGDIDGTPQGGFLPPDDAAGDGEGYVSFQVDPESSLANGAKVDARASIVFDTNAAISTNTWVNTIDSKAPTATVAPLPATEPGPFTVSWSGKASASAISTYNVYVSTDNGAWALWQSAVKATSARYPGVLGHLYQFAATATDLLGNTGPVPQTFQTFTKDEVPKFPPVLGYRLVASDGGIFAFGKGVGFYGSTGGQSLAAPIVDMAATPDGKGYWLVGANGRVFGFGDAHNYGSTGALNKPVVGMAATPDGKGYWLVATDGGIFTLGDARFFGSTGAVRLNKPILGMAATPDGKGYWLVASDGGIFTFGDARFFGSTGAVRLAKPIVGMAATPDGKGYWLVASDGGIFTFGDARFFGSTGAVRLRKPIVGMSLVL